MNREGLESYFRYLAKEIIMITICQVIIPVLNIAFFVTPCAAVHQQ